jgi:hypothetical protein
MQDTTTKLTAKASDQHKPYKSSDQRIALHLCYGEIGIPAVAAAARYVSDVRNAGYPRVVTEPEYRRAAIA